MRLITFNIRHARGLDDTIDLQRVLSVITPFDADVIALQEVDRFMSRSGYVDQAAELARALQMNWRFAASLRHGRSEYGNAILSRQTIVTDEVSFFPGEKERRSLLMTKLDTELGLLTVLTTHLGVTERDRTRQTPMLISQLSKVQSPSILMGDLNMESNHQSMADIKRAGWQQVMLDNSKLGTVIGGSNIDHIFTRDIRNLSKAYSFATAASDHYPVIVEISDIMV